MAQRIRCNKEAKRARSEMAFRLGRRWTQQNERMRYTDLSRCSTVGVGTIGAPPSTNTKRWLGLGRLKERQHAVGITRSGQRGVATKTRFKFVCMTLEICHVFMTCYQLSHLAERRPSCAGVQCNLWIVVSQNQPNCLRTARTMYSTPFFSGIDDPLTRFSCFNHLNPISKLCF